MFDFSMFSCLVDPENDTQLSRSEKRIMLIESWTNTIESYWSMLSKYDEVEPCIDEDGVDLNKVTLQRIYDQLGTDLEYLKTLVSQSWDSDIEALVRYYIEKCISLQLTYETRLNQ